MKKLPVLFSTMLIAALFLAACGANNNPAQTPGVVDPVVTPVVPETGGELPTPTLAATEVVVVEPTATVAAEVQPTATVFDVVNECRPHLLTSYLDYEIAGADGEEIGEIDGIVILRDASIPATTGAPDFTTFTAGQYANPVIGYFVVDFDDAAGYGDAETLIPFNAFTGLIEQTMVEDCRLVLNNSYELDNFPVWDWDLLPDYDFNDENWDNEWAGFWNNLGVNVPTTADNGQALGNAVVFRDNFDDINVLNLNGEDLGEIEEFIINPSNGQITHALLATGGFLGIGEKWIPIPINQVIWGNFDDDRGDYGEIYINHPDDNWDDVPAIDDLDDVDFTLDTWDDEFDAYWQSVNVR
jgi:sporulation protein YlmC with PRC-barrel domain